MPWRRESPKGLIHINVHEYTATKICVILPTPVSAISPDFYNHHMFNHLHRYVLGIFWRQAAIIICSRKNSGILWSQEFDELSWEANSHTKRRDSPSLCARHWAQSFRPHHGSLSQCDYYLNRGTQRMVSGAQMIGRVQRRWRKLVQNSVFKVTHITSKKKQQIIPSDGSLHQNAIFQSLEQIVTFGGTSTQS